MVARERALRCAVLGSRIPNFLLQPTWKLPLHQNLVVEEGFCWQIHLFNIYKICTFPSTKLSSFLPSPSSSSLSSSSNNNNNNIHIRIINYKSKAIVKAEPTPQLKIIPLSSLPPIVSSNSTHLYTTPPISSAITTTNHQRPNISSSQHPTHAASPKSWSQSRSQLKSAPVPVPARGISLSLTHARHHWPFALKTASRHVVPHRVTPPSNHVNSSGLPTLSPRLAHSSNSTDTRSPFSSLLALLRRRRPPPPPAELFSPTFASMA